jgi:iron complex outermembrane receptor protein
MKTFAILFLVTGFAQAEEVTDYQLPEISVLGQSNKNSAFDYLPTVSKVSGAKLERKRQSTLGETLSREAGVASSFFGPNASRPVIRGLDGERVRMLENGLGVLDASGASPDHAVSIDPLLVESIEILRGPSALMYGSSAVGGVVNVRTNRISETSLDENKINFNTRYSTVDQGKNFGGVTRFKLGNYVLHFDGAIRSSEDYSTPVGKVVNSSNRTSQGAMGLSYVYRDGFVGGAFSGYLSEYGTVAEPDVKINLDRVRFDLAGEARKLGFLDSLRFKSAYTKYEHKEIAAGVTGTVFKNRGVESRVDAKHENLLVGLQQQYFKFSALGDEAFLPSTTNTSFALFGFHESQWGRVKPGIGLRFESANVTSETDDRFGVGVAKTFFAPSASLGFQYALNEVSEGSPEWILGLNGTYTERAPNYQELFANGTHVATNAFEVGSQNFATEKNFGLELSLKAKSAEHEGRFATYYQNFSNYIALSPTGTNNDGEDATPDTDDDIPIYQFAAVKARLFGAELEYLYKMPTEFLSGMWELEAKWDWVRGLDLTNHDFLPRIVPMRATLGLNYKHTSFSADIEYQRTEGQETIARNETATRGYNMVNMGSEIPFNTTFGNFKCILRLNNIFDVEARNHVSFLKTMAPQPGRNFTIGVQAAL